MQEEEYDFQESIIGGRWRMTQYSDYSIGRSGFPEKHTVWDFVRSPKSRYCGKLYKYINGQPCGSGAPYSCTDGSITFCSKMIFSGEDDFEFQVTVYHYRMLEGLSLQLTQYDIQDVNTCRAVGVHESLIKSVTTLLFEPDTGGLNPTDTENNLKPFNP